MHIREFNAQVDFACFDDSPVSLIVRATSFDILLTLLLHLAKKCTTVSTIQYEMLIVDLLVD